MEVGNLQNLVLYLYLMRNQMSWKCKAAARTHKKPATFLQNSCQPPVRLVNQASVRLVRRPRVRLVTRLPIRLVTRLPLRLVTRPPVRLVKRPRVRMVSDRACGPSADRSYAWSPDFFLELDPRTFVDFCFDLEHTSTERWTQDQFWVLTLRSGPLALQGRFEINARS